MTEPIRVYPTETPGLYRTKDGRKATHYPIHPAHLVWCIRCTQILSTGVGLHWRIANDLYCQHCVQVAGEAVVP